MFKRKFLRLARMGKAAVAKVIGRLREYLSARLARKKGNRRPHAALAGARSQAMLFLLRLPIPPFPS
jgi:hypothetical protein